MQAPIHKTPLYSPSMIFPVYPVIGDRLGEFDRSATVAISKEQVVDCFIYNVATVSTIVLYRNGQMVSIIPCDNNWTGYLQYPNEREILHNNSYLHGWESSGLDESIIYEQTDVQIVSNVCDCT